MSPIPPFTPGGGGGPLPGSPTNFDVVRVTDGYQILASDRLVLVEGAVAGRDVKLPAVAGLEAGHTVTVSDVAIHANGGAPITVNLHPDDVGTVLGEMNAWGGAFLIASQNGSVTLMLDKVGGMGPQWCRVAENTSGS